jgi:NosR/NirI family transcriptional regulator, nitrous oxide reductase regulator
MRRGWSKPVLLRVYRAAILVCALLLIHAQYTWLEGRGGNPFSLAKAKQFFPDANRVQLRDPERGLHIVANARGDVLGALLRTSPFSDEIVGYSGPNDVLIALDPRGAVLGLELLRSGDTPEYVRKVTRGGFLDAFRGWRPQDEAPPKVQGVSGATLTSFALAEAVHQRLVGSGPSLRFPEPITLADVQRLFTNAASIVPEQKRWRVLDQQDRTLGFILRTSPQSDNVPGYRGPTDSLVAIAPDGLTVIGLRPRRSFDNDAYVEQVRRAEPFLNRFVGRKLDELAAYQYVPEKVDGISGATITARAIAEGVKRRAAADMREPTRNSGWRWQHRDTAMAMVLLGALTISFTSLRGRPWLRLGWAALLVGYVGLVQHDFLSLALLGGWAAHGSVGKIAPGLLLLAALALVVPWTTRHQLYCHHVCPHGAAQQLLGRVGARLGFRRGGQLGRRPGALNAAARVLALLPGILLMIALLAVLLGWSIHLVSLEAFDAWNWSTARWSTLALAAAGLVAALFVPQPYCRFGCPTGALLRFVRAAGSADHWGRRDAAALSLLLIGTLVAAGARIWPPAAPEVPPLLFTGRAMGTTWSVKLRDEVADTNAIQKAIAREFEWAESMTSHWRTNTGISEFNRALTTNAVPVPWPVLTLVRWGNEVSEASGGAYDVTVGPFVRLWGFGPGPARAESPRAEEITATAPAVGWQKLDLLDGMLRKRHPGMQLDLSSIAKGWAIDRVAEVLARRGFTNFLVEAGGELRASDQWRVAVENPPRPCVLVNEAIATSGTYRQKFSSGGREFSHLIDPRTGRTVTHQTVSVSVRHRDCARADAWATALNVLGVEAGLPLAERLAIAAQFVVQSGDGKLHLHESKAWAPRRSE